MLRRLGNWMCLREGTRQTKQSRENTSGAEPDLWLRFNQQKEAAPPQRPRVETHARGVLQIRLLIACLLPLDVTSPLVSNMTFCFPPLPPSLRPSIPQLPIDSVQEKMTHAPDHLKPRHEVTRIGWKIGYEMEGSPLGCCITERRTEDCVRCQPLKGSNCIICSLREPRWIDGLFTQ